MAQPPAPVSFSFAPAPVVPEPAPTPRIMKDSSSVLGILQMAKDNAARQRMGNSRGGVGGGASADGGAGGSGSASEKKPAVSPMETLNLKIRAAGDSSGERRAAEKEVLEQLPKLDTMKIADLVTKVYASEALRRGPFLDDLCAALVQSIPRFRSTDLTKLTATCAQWALDTGSGSADDTKSKLGDQLRAFFNSVANEVLLRLMDIAPSDLAKISTALASIGVGGVRLFSSLSRAGVARGDRFSPIELVALVGAFDKARYFSTALFDSLAKSMKANIKDVPPKDIVLGMQSLARCGIQGQQDLTALGEVVGDHMSKDGKTALSAEDYCALSWTFCALGLNHDKLFRTTFQALEDANVSASETLCQLYEIHLALKAFHHGSYKEYELEDETVQNLRTHFKKHGGGQSRSQKLERSSERIHADVADMLGEVVEGSISSGYATSLGYTVDIAAEKKRGSKSTPIICLEVDGPSTLIRSLDPQENVGFGQAQRVRGAARLKRRILEKNGFRVGVLTEDEWKTFDGDRQKEAHLKRLSKEAGVSSDRLR